MNNKADQAEQAQHTISLDKNRNWQQKVDDPFYASKVFFMEDGRIGIEHGGHVIVRSLELWMYRTSPLNRGSSDE